MQKEEQNIIILFKFFCYNGEEKLQSGTVTFPTCSYGLFPAYPKGKLPAATRTIQRATLSTKQQVEKDEVYDFIFFLPHLALDKIKSSLILSGKVRNISNLVFKEAG